MQHRHLERTVPTGFFCPLIAWFLGAVGFSVDINVTDDDEPACDGFSSRVSGLGMTTWTAETEGTTLGGTVRRRGSVSVPADIFFSPTLFHLPIWSPLFILVCQLSRLHIVDLSRLPQIAAVPAITSDSACINDEVDLSAIVICKLDLPLGVPGRRHECGLVGRPSLVSELCLWRGSERNTSD